MKREMTRINLTCYDRVWINSPTSPLKLWNWSSSGLSTDIAADRQRVRWLYKVFQAWHDGLLSISSAALRPCLYVCWPKRKAHEGQGASPHSLSSKSPPWLRLKRTKAHWDTAETRYERMRGRWETRGTETEREKDDGVYIRMVLLGFECKVGQWSASGICTGHLIFEFIFYFIFQTL